MMNVPLVRGPARCGVLAFGSLIWEPGELSELDKIGEVACMTPWPVEYARRSCTRHWAPTLVRVRDGRPVEARVLLYWNEPDTVKATLATREEINLQRNRSGIETCVVLGVQVRPIWYTALRLNISDLRPECLARLAISSVKPAGDRNGVRYLRRCIEHGIYTALTEAYSAEILRISGCGSLEEAELWAAK